MTFNGRRNTAYRWQDWEVRRSEGNISIPCVSRSTWLTWSQSHRIWKPQSAAAIFIRGYGLNHIYASISSSDSSMCMFECIKCLPLKTHLWKTKHWILHGLENAFMKINVVVTNNFIAGFYETRGSLSFHFHLFRLRNATQNNIAHFRDGASYILIKDYENPDFFPLI